ncbi:P-type conjugative transfer protein TrbJ [Sphingomonas sp. JC676]|uniref:P-type conjugative transfer protein TrbJ n=1 Tax=Sphingomonas sp. JC676 TaxID=2768065 RepID=UPI00165849DA|nr:P-type conjugative transfer protein TrbJ [Sphingomonas sp. JC676]MBC9030843.1 P-type conjugative transfer protein TrbJ [Sphingomonas sp. JC676]
MFASDLKKTLISSAMGLGMLVSLAGALLTAEPAHAQLTVFDPTNYSQNMLTAARALEQINNQITSLQHEAQMLTDFERNLSPLTVFHDQQQLFARLSAIDTLISQAKGIGFKASDVEAQFRALYPDFDTKLSASAIAAQAQARLDTAITGFRHTMQVQAQIAEAVQADAGTLAKIMESSQNAAGAQQVGQATNQLLALTAKQQMQIQELLAAQGHADAVERARQAQSQRDARAATTKFLGTGYAYQQ